MEIESNENLPGLAGWLLLAVVVFWAWGFAGLLLAYLFTRMDDDED